MDKVYAQVLCEFEGDEQTRKVRLLYISDIPEGSYGTFIADSWDGEAWIESTAEELNEAVVRALYEYWQYVKRLKGMD